MGSSWPKTPSLCSPGWFRIKSARQAYPPVYAKKIKTDFDQLIDPGCAGSLRASRGPHGDFWPRAREHLFVPTKSKKIDWVAKLEN
jgi:hypothetical protein